MNNINFTGKFILYGQRETVDKAKNKMKSKSERFSSFGINAGENKILLVATGKDRTLLDNAAQNSEFKNAIMKILKGDKKNLFEKLASFAFATTKNVPFLSENALNEYLRHRKCFEDIDYNSGANPLIENKRHAIHYVDGSTRVFSARGNEIKQTLKDVTIIQENASGQKTYVYPNGIVEYYNYNNRLLSRKYPNGSEEFFDKINGRIKTKILPDGKKVRYCYHGDEISGVLDENKNQGKIGKNGEIVWAKPQIAPESTLNDEENAVRTKITRGGIIQKCLGRRLLEERFPDGRIKKYDERGITEIHPNGKIYHYNKYGKPLDF